MNVTSIYTANFAVITTHIPQRDRLSRELLDGGRGFFPQNTTNSVRKLSCSRSTFFRRFHALYGEVQLGHASIPRFILASLLLWNFSKSRPAPAGRNAAEEMEAWNDEGPANDWGCFDS
jgi:hypothetical protein